ncbi:hypothetical protein ACLOJK_023428 [Asimina triloba]
MATGLGEDDGAPYWCSSVVKYEHSSAAVEAIKMSVDFLAGKLATGSPDIQRQAAFELRLLAKSGMDHRRMIAEAEAIPFLPGAAARRPRLQDPRECRHGPAQPLHLR